MSKQANTKTKVRIVGNNNTVNIKKQNTVRLGSKKIVLSKNRKIKK